LLKTLEEPPPRGLILLICHRPAAALITIRSRSRQLRLHRLAESDMRSLDLPTGSEELLRLADGRPGRALALARGEGPRFAAELLAGLERSRQGPSALLATWPKTSAEGWSQFDLAIEVLGDALRRASVAASLGQSPPGWAAAISPLACAAAWSRLMALHAEADRLDLDPAQAFALATQVLDQTLAPSA
jgi:DNA polymerase-3 subunit delta'